MTLHTAFTPGGERLLTELDHQRLRRLAPEHESLQELLDNAELLPSAQLPADIVSMNSVVEVRDPASGRTQRLTLCYPGEAKPELGRISVLSPVGLSLLGRPVGSRATWQALPQHSSGLGKCVLQIQALRYQPEASGDLTL